ncbi:MAG: HD-GYP domain-containing protein [Bacillota bacterium]
MLNIDLKDIFSSLSTALDFTYTGLSSHHKRVALMAVKLALKLGLSDDTIKNIFIASIIHDIGAISMRDKELLGCLEIEDPFTHSDLGYYMTRKIKFLEPASGIIRSHHDAWSGNNPSGLKGDDIPLESRIINAVDRLDVMIKPGVFVLEQTQGIIAGLKKISGTVLDPDLFIELAELSKSEGFWLDLDSQFLPAILCDTMDSYNMVINNEMLLDISLLFASVIDKKSAFTHKHSRLVAASAKLFAQISGFSKSDSEKMVVAGLLHDLGKLSIPEEILQKPGKLNPEEFSIIKRHTYFTHRILDRIGGFDEINRWASFHHEKIDGTGYPFRLSGESLPHGSRYMSVCDVFAALAENRPYRKGMPRDRIIEILKDMSHSALDARAVKTIEDNYDYFEKLLKYEDPLCV